MLETSELQDSPLKQVSKDEVLIRVGQLTRMFHDSLHSLGIDQLIQYVAYDIPDARERLNYVAKLTEQAAERVLNATDTASPLQDELHFKAVSMGERWKSVMAAPSLKCEYNQTAEETIQFLDYTTLNTKETKEQLMAIMMAQDFQDLTGQVIKKVTSLAQELEKQLIQVLVDFSPTTKKTEECLLNNPQDDLHKKTGVLVSQKQVDELLGSMGF